MNVFDLVAKISLDRSQYDESLGDAGKEFEGFGAKIKKGLGTAAKVGGAAIAAVGAAGVALTKTVLDGAAQTAAYGDNIDKMSQKMGISAQAYQEWDAILQHSGSSIDGMQRGMMTLASAAEKNSDAFQKLGISEEDVASMNQEDLFAAVIEGLQGMEEGTERAVLAQELLGGAAKELGPLLNTSAEDTEAMRQAVHDLGGVMSDEAVKAAAAYQDSLQDMQTAFKGLSRELFSNFMPSITKVMGGLTDIFSGNGDKGIGAISEGIDELVSNISDKIPEFLDLGLGIVEALGSAVIKNLPKLLEAAGKIVGQIIAGIVASLPKLIKQAPEIIKAVVSGLAAAWPDIKAAGMDLLHMLWSGIESAVTRLRGNLSDVLEQVKSDVSDYWNGIKDSIGQVWENIRTSVSQKVDAIKTNLTQKWDAIRASVTGKIDALRSNVSSRFESIRNTIRNVIERIKGLFNFSWELPHIKLPHINYSLIEVPVLGSIPDPRTLSVSWYKKAYDQPYVFTEPTVMRGFGDGNGGEMVYGKDNLMRDIREAVSDLETNVVINIYNAKDLDETEVAKRIERIFVDRAKQRRLLNA